jgi:hypothetical protein
MPMNVDPAGSSGTHVRDEDLLRLIDDELAASEAEAVRDHVGRCLGCAARLNRLRQFSTDTSAAYRVGARFIRTARLGAAIVATMFALYWLEASRVAPGTPLLASLRIADLPVSYLTPGVTRPVTSAELCRAAGERDTPSVPPSIKHAVLREYGAGYFADEDFELDYLITPELGGVMDAQNLWPERYASQTWNARAKDDLEQLLRRLVCSGSLPLESAQRDIAGNWIAAYKRYFHTDRPGGWPAALPRPVPLLE